MACVVFDWEGLSRPWCDELVRTPRHVLMVHALEAPQFPNSFHFRTCLLPGCLDREVGPEALSYSKMSVTYPNWSSFTIVISLLPLACCVLRAVEIGLWVFTAGALLSKWALLCACRTGQHLDPTATTIIKARWFWTILKTHVDFTILSNLQLIDHSAFNLPNLSSGLKRVST